MRLDDWRVRAERWARVRSHVVTVSGSRVHLLQAGSAAPSGAPTQLLLHGLGAGGAFLLDLVGPLTAYGPVVAPDLPGSIFGETDTAHPDAARVDSNARFVQALLTELGPRVLGRHTIERKLAYLDGNPVRSSLAGLGADLSRIPPDTMEVWTDLLAGVRDHPETLEYAATALASVLSGIFVDQASTWRTIDQIDAPVLVLWGNEDPLVERPMIEQLLARHPDWHLHVFEGAGHAAPVERPDEYVGAFARWLATPGESVHPRRDGRPRTPGIRP